MNLALRPASLPEDTEELIAVLQRNFPGSPMRAIFRWRREGNPAGAGWTWVVYDRQSGAIGAMTSLYPRPMYIDGKLVLCGQVAEFAVDEAYRSLGPAMMLQRATFEPVDSEEVALCYDCPPHDRGMSTFIRLAMRPSCELTRYAVLLRSEEVVANKLGHGAWTKPLIAGANLLLTPRRGIHRTSGLEVCSLEGRFGDEFTRLDQMVPSLGIIRSSRSMEVLNWRYCDRFESNVEVLIARNKGELVAFLACVVDPDGRASILDLFGQNLEEAGLALLGAAIELYRRKNAFCLEGYCSETSELKRVFKAAGFRARERAARVVAYAKPGGRYGIQTSSVSWPLGQAEMYA